MKKLILIYTFIFYSLATVAQSWKPVNIDDSVQISLPPGFKKTDTLGQTVINASTSFGNIIITKQPDNPEADVATQFTEPENTNGKKPAGSMNLMMIGGGLLLLVIIVILIIIRRKRRRI